MEKDVDRILISQERIRKQVEVMASEISESYADLDESLTLVSILSGSIVFLADLIRNLPMRIRIGLITVSSYFGLETQSHGSLLQKDLNIDVTNRHVLLIDDILDTGGTLRLVQDQLRDRGVKSLKTAVLLRKIDKAPRDIEINFIGFDIEDAFVVGYGLDFNSEYRNLPYIAVLKSSLYNRSSPS